MATRSFAPGDLILEERPLLSPAMAVPAAGGHWPGLLREGPRLPPELHESLLLLLAFSQATPETREEVRRGFYTPRDAGRADPETEERATLAVRGLKIGGLEVARDDAVTALLALRYNSFSYPALGADGKAEDTCALFSLASKCEHSCFPKAVYKVETAGAPARFVAVAPIAADERISIGYVDCTMPTALRLRHCWERFAFVCCCHRCAGDPSNGTPPPPDAARAVRCWVCGGSLQPLGAGGGCEWRCVGGGEAYAGCGLSWGPEEVRRRLGLDDLDEALRVQEALARGECAEAAEVSAWLQRLEALGPRHWAVRSLQRRRLGLLLRQPGDLPQGAGQAALEGLMAAVEDGGVAAATQLAWEGVALAAAVRLCRASAFLQAGTLAAACLPVLRIVCTPGSGLLLLAGRLVEACAAEDAGLLDKKEANSALESQPQELFRFLE